MDAQAEEDVEMPQDTSSIFCCLWIFTPLVAFHSSAIHSLKDVHPRFHKLAAAIFPYTFCP